MNNFRNIKANTYITNKIIKKIQGGGAFCTNRLAQKCLSVALILALAVGMVPSKKAQAQLAGEPTTFVSTARANHWGRSDLRAYLNNATKTDKTLPIDSATGGTRSGNFPAKFSDAEFGVVQPFTYQMNVLDRLKNVTATCETTDRFWLPSANYSSNKIISWGSEDISANTQYSKSTAADKARIIPISYWSYGASTDSWLRSSLFDIDYFALKTSRGIYVYNGSVDYTRASAAACKINLNSEICGSVIFASAASAANLAAAAGGAQKIEIAGSENFGKKVGDALPDYGMYLKTRSDKTFTANSLSLSGNNLTVRYTGGEAGQYVVVQAFKEDSLTAGTTGYAAAQQLEAGQTSEIIDVTNWGISSLDGYTVKVWMEDGSGSLAKATTPTTFVGTTKTATGAVQNGRVFALKADLQCSWGDLAALDETAYNNILLGRGQDGTDGASSNLVCGVNPTNQKIIFGGMEFWIAGRETAANGGAISKDGDIMTLYQAKSVETRRFNESIRNYTVDGKPAVMLKLAEDPASAMPYPEGKIITANLVYGYTLNWLYRTPGTNAWTEGMPTALGTHEVRCYTPGTENYERTYSNVVNFIIKKIPEPSNFVFTGPSNLVYDGTPKTVTIEPKPGITGMGAITIKYYIVYSNGTKTLLSGPPTVASPDGAHYEIWFDVAEGTEFTAKTDLPVILN